MSPASHATASSRPLRPPPRLPSAKPRTGTEAPREQPPKPHRLSRYRTIIFLTHLQSPPPSTELNFKGKLVHVDATRVQLEFATVYDPGAFCFEPFVK